MKNLQIAILLLFSMFLFSSCEDVIDLDLDAGTSQLAVDALVKVNDGVQKVRLTMTSEYFDNASPARGATGATVVLTSNLGQTYTFIESTSNAGDYFSADSIKAITGEAFTLNISYRGNEFYAISPVVRGTIIDTLFVEERPAQFGNEAGKYFQLIARDSVGFGDYCWIRYKLNGQTDLRISSLQSALPVDAAFALGNADGLEFIFPIRNTINGDKPYLVGDTMDVELLSIDAEQWRFLNEMVTQLNNVGLFAEPIANVRGNVMNRDSKSKVKAVGCFGMARSSRARAVVE